MNWIGPAISIGSKLIGGILGRNDAAAANKEWWDRTLWQAQSARNVSNRDFKRGRHNMKLADRMSDKNVRLAQKWQARQAEKAWDRTDAAALRNRNWAKSDYRQQKADMGNQFVALRRAAKKAGLNPLSVLGASMVPGPAGGLSSGSYGAAPGVGAMPVAAMGVSSPMAGSAGEIAMPPVSSNEAIMGGIYELGMELSGEAAQQRANAQVAADLMKIELEQAKARAVAPMVPPDLSGSALGPQPTVYGGNRGTVPSLGSTFRLGKAPEMSMSDSWASEGADFGIESVPAPATTGRAVIKNKVTDWLVGEDGASALIGPDGELIGLGQAAVLAGSMLPQIGAHWGQKAVDGIAEWQDRKRAQAQWQSKMHFPSLGFDELNPFAVPQGGQQYVNPMY